MYMYEEEAERLWDGGLRVCLFIEIVTKAQSPALATKLSFLLLAVWPTVLPVRLNLRRIAVICNLRRIFGARIQKRSG